MYLGVTCLFTSTSPNTNNTNTVSYTHLDYTKIYNANTDKISNPNLIYPGQVLTLP